MHYLMIPWFVLAAYALIIPLRFVEHLVGSCLGRIILVGSMFGGAASGFPV